MKIVLRSVLILVLSILLTKWLVALGLLGWLLQTETGLDLYISAANALGIIGGEDGEFMLLALMVFVVLAPSTFLVGAAAKVLHTLRAERQSTANKQAGR
ncbi:MULTISPECIES: hypothetical protein [Pseudomonas]|uniref:hypothetical protein n=1 Tax=Pseudomonas TaxID=286 RepID=UPI000730786A|nr:MULTISPECIES: hypothetical protein [Pseudomonas]KTB74868.1 hypothetical protein AO068_05975 [Pseudomonas sp. ICMP 3272]KTC55583.1 hypothetical protein AO258_12330 [Pseudomonas syringae ICMP 19498]